MGDRTGYKPTAAVMADTYDERVLEEMKETLAATVFAETFTDKLDYENLANQDK